MINQCHIHHLCTLCCGCVVKLFPHLFDFDHNCDHFLDNKSLFDLDIIIDHLIKVSEFILLKQKRL